MSNPFSLRYSTFSEISRPPRYVSITVVRSPRSIDPRQNHSKKIFSFPIEGTPLSGKMAAVRLSTHIFQYGFKFCRLQ